MIQSMTGFGKHVVQLPTKKITVELKSLNSKSLDLNARMPPLYREKELELRKIIASALLRGKVDFNLYVEITGDETTSQINEAVVKHYMKQLRTIADGDDMRLMEMALKLPDTLKTDKDEVDPEEYKAILEALKHALALIEKPPVFCAIQEHAGMVRDFINQSTPQPGLHHQSRLPCPRYRQQR